MSAISQHVTSAASWVAHQAGTISNFALAGVEKVGNVALDVLKFLGTALAAGFNGVQGLGKQALQFVAAHPQGTSIGLGLAVLVGSAALVCKALHNRPAPVVGQQDEAQANQDPNAAAL